MQMKREFFIFSYKGNWKLLSQGENLIRGHESSLLVLRTCFRRDETI